MTRDVKAMTDTEILDYLEQRKDRFVVFAPSGQWGLFIIETMGMQGCYGGTIRQCVEKAVKYDFPSSAGYEQMMKDESEL